MPIKILIADDHGLIRAGLRALLNEVPEYQVVGEAADGHTVLRLVAELQPDIVLMDVSMPGMNGIEATSRLREISPNTYVLALTAHEDESMLVEMIRAGASGYIIKRAVDSELIQAIRVIVQGDMYVYPAMTRTLFKDLSPKSKTPSVEHEALTPREIDVLRLLARGYTNRQIALELKISPRTVEGHRSSLTDKLGFRGRVELINYAEKQGLLEPRKNSG